MAAQSIVRNLLIHKLRASCQSVSYAWVTFAVLLAMVPAKPSPAQVMWFKFDGNPVMDFGPIGAWDRGNVIASQVIFSDSLYRMWYSGLSGNNMQMGYAISRDGVTWKRSASNPILTIGPPASWEGKGVLLGSVLIENSIYRMWYQGINSSDLCQIGYATSPDGIHWKKYAFNPVLGPASWYSQGEGPTIPCVLPVSRGTYRMWFGGQDQNSEIRIGYAEATSPISWSPAANPALSSGSSNSWNSMNVFAPRVLANEQGGWEMWYGGNQGRIPSNKFGYATSPDGKNWIQNSQDPVLACDSATWEYGGMNNPVVLFEGGVYHMWYSAGNFPAWRVGYAISPKGLTIELHRLSDLSEKDSAQVTVRVPHTLALAFKAEFRALNGRSVSTLPLFDDGLHRDSLARDGIFSNACLLPGDGYYFMDLKTQMQQGGKTLDFTMRGPFALTTIRNVSIDSLEFVKDQDPNPGDTLRLALLLRHHGTSGTIPAVTASLASADTWTSDIPAAFLEYGDLIPGGSARTKGYYRLFVKPDCPPETEVKLDVSVSAAGMPFLHRRVSFRVASPWRKSIWVLPALAVVLGGGSVIGIRYSRKRRLKRRIAILETERALEQERARISQDMHDEVGSNLSEIVILTELAKNKPDQVAQRVKEISERTAELIDNVSEIVWATNPRNDTLDNLVGHVRRYAVEYLSLAGLRVDFDTPEAIPGSPVTAIVRRNLFLVVKEALHNIVKHANATHVEIDFGFTEKQVEAIIRDNGRGFQKGDVREGANGLMNMRKRMTDIGGEFRIESVPGSGTWVTFTLPFAP